MIPTAEVRTYKSSEPAVFAVVFSRGEDWDAGYTESKDDADEVARRFNDEVRKAAADITDAMLKRKVLRARGTLFRWRTIGRT